MMRINDGKGAIIMNKIAEFIKINRKAAGLTQEEFAMRSGLGQLQNMVHARVVFWL